jgi:archaellum component FlaC
MNKPVQIEQAAQALTPAQKQFNILLKKINTAKKKLADWQNVPQAHQQKMGIFQPLVAELRAEQAAMARALDVLHDNKLFKKKDKEKIAYLICDLCLELIEVEGYEDLKSLYDQYSEVDFDTEQAQSQSMVSDMAKTIFEAEFGTMEGVDFTDPEAIADAIARKLCEPEAPKTPPKKRTAKQLAKDAKAEAEAANVSKSIQAVYRQLVGALHPDREQDPAERARKTELMQRITVAYKNKDLLQLLELQLSVEQIDQHAINRIADDRLKHFNQVLKDQLNELEMEVDQMKMQYGHLLQGFSHFVSITPKNVIDYLDIEISNVRLTLHHIKHDNAHFASPVLAKNWLKSYRIPQEEDVFFGDMGNMPFGFR